MLNRKRSRDRLRFSIFVPESPSFRDTFPLFGSFPLSNIATLLIAPAKGVSMRLKAMLIRPLLVSLVLGAIALNGVQPAQGTPEAKKDVDEAIDQRLFPDGRVYNFGTVLCGRRVEHLFRIVNRSDSPLHVVNVRVSVGALVIRSTKEVLQPNEEGGLEIEVNTRRFRGAKTQTVYLAIEQGERWEEYRFEITCTSVEPSEFLQ
jgi:hypothetical protein